MGRNRREGINHAGRIGLKILGVPMAKTKGRRATEVMKDGRGGNDAQPFGRYLAGDTTSAKLQTHPNYAKTKVRKNKRQRHSGGKTS